MREGAPVVVRWLGLFRGALPRTEAEISQLLDWEIHGALRDRAAEVLWRGRSIAGTRGPGIGLAFTADAVRIARTSDCWSEPGDHATGRLTLRRSVPRRAWKRWDAFAREWARMRPHYHAEAWVAMDAEPVAVAIGLWAEPWLRATALSEAVRRRLGLLEVRAMG